MVADSLTIHTQSRTEVINVTDKLAEMVSGVTDGLAVFYIPHTTAALLICEDDDELRRDLVKTAEQWLAGLRPFAHIRNNNPNAEAHLISALAGASITVVLKQGRLDLGKYQNILFLEMDGPKAREIRCRVIGG